MVKNKIIIIIILSSFSIISGCNFECKPKIIVIDETGREAELFFSGMGEFRLNNAIVFNGDPSLWVPDFGLEKVTRSMLLKS